jgi:periplasmic divalent cation tolerance protein
LPAEVILVLTQVPNRAYAEAIAAALIEARLAACVSIGTPVDSLYHWRGKIETANEIPLAAKTSAERYAEVEAAIRAHHPYELPEILAVPVSCGLASYLRWVVDETGAPPPAG